jgi:hypothetical protein
LKKAELIVGRCLIIAISFYCFYNPNVLTFNGYSLANDGVVVARALLLIFSMFNLLEVFKEIRQQ